MGAGETYNNEEKLEIAKVMLQNIGKDLGPMFWRRQFEANALSSILHQRYMQGGDISKFLNRNKVELEKIVSKIVLFKSKKAAVSVKNLHPVRDDEDEDEEDEGDEEEAVPPREPRAQGAEQDEKDGDKAGDKEDWDWEDLPAGDGGRQEEGAGVAGDEDDEYYEYIKKNIGEH